MKKFTNVRDKDRIVFKNLSDSSELIVNHFDEEYICDTIFIDEKYDLDFVNYIVHILKETDDIGVLFAKYDSRHLEKVLANNGLKVSNYQYTIRNDENYRVCEYEVSDVLKFEEKNFYLGIINKLARENCAYLNPDKEFQEYGDRWFEIEDYQYRTYRKNGVIVGIVDYKNFECDAYCKEVSNDCFDYNGKLCIRCLLSEDEKVLEDMLRDLLATYKKEIVINVTYGEKSLKAVLNKFDCKFDFCQYVLIEKK